MSANRVLSVEKGLLVAYPSRPNGHYELNEVFKLFHDSGYVLSQGYCSYSGACEIDCCSCRLCWYPFSFDTGKANCGAASVERSWNRQSSGAALVMRSIPAIPIIFVEEASVSLSSANS